jgi:hypothetical protein
MPSQKPFDDAPQWYWAVAASKRTDSEQFNLAGNRFVVACGQKELWLRVRAEISSDGQCSWLALGPKDGNATLADCMAVFLSAREGYGASYNRIVLELARVPAFASFIHNARQDLCNFVSNPTTTIPLPREPYSTDAQERLRRTIKQTLNLPDDD